VFDHSTSGENYYLTGDSLTYHNGQSFTTKDRDHDQHGGNCATTYKGAWWYKTCYYSNLNGLYLPGQTAERAVVWHHWKKSSLKKVEMKMRPVV